MRRLLVGSLALALLAPVGAVRATSDAAPPSAADYLRAIVDRSPAPEYRRFGTDAIARVAAYGTKQLRRSGYRVLADDVSGFTRWAVDYSAGHEPALARLSDDHAFKTDSAFDITPTGPEGVTCTVRQIADVQPGDCGFVPFADASPEWKNTSSSSYRSDVDTIIAKGGVGVVVQGDVARNLVFALRLKKNIPAVVAAVSATDVVGQQVQLRAMGALVPATAHNVVGVLRPPVGSSQYVLLTAHMDGWYQAAADNGGGAAAVLRAAHLLAEQRPSIGVAVALFDGEEVGLLGSQAVASQLSSPGGLDVGDGGPPLHMTDLKADVNLDASSARASDVQNNVHSVAGTDAPLFSWRAMVFSEEPVLANAFVATFAAHQVLGLPLTAGAAYQANGGLTRTDSNWFHKAGVPVAWPVAGYPEYHTDGDVPSAMNLADLEHVAEAAADLAGQIATLPIGPVPAQAR